MLGEIPSGIQITRQLRGRVGPILAGTENHLLRPKLVSGQRSVRRWSSQKMDMLRDASVSQRQKINDIFSVWIGNQPKQIHSLGRGKYDQSKEIMLVV